MSARVLYFVGHGLWFSGTGDGVVRCLEIVTRSSAIIMHNFGCVLFKHRQFDTVCACTHKLASSQTRQNRLTFRPYVCAHDWGLCSLTFFSLMFHGLTSLFLSLGPKQILCAYGLCLWVSFCLFISHIIRFFMSCCLHLPILLTVSKYNGNFRTFPTGDGGGGQP